ncbi:MAG TPA: divalent-cation tolerance protein CutA [Pyrinomonadaceae bacterium]|jgi:periplasmic divalent cation tolerance protein|nr:divalent-cation tolerance protein CutA [Pyrinomonadaceae bacterium]
MDENRTDAIVVLMTAGSREEAARLAEMLVGARLAACVQIMPEMESIYHWKGSVHRDPEFLLLAKTTRAKFDDLEREVRALHSYETPEIIALPVTTGSAPYLEYLTATVEPLRNLQAEAGQESSVDEKGVAKGGGL